MTENQALDVLTATIQDTHTTMNGYTVGSPAYNAGMRRAVFLKSIYGGISGGASVQDAFLSTYDANDNSNIYPALPYATFTLPEVQAEGNFAIALLRTN
jgi:hypothetical protein